MKWKKIKKMKINRERKESKNEARNDGQDNDKETNLERVEIKNNISRERKKSRNQE